jgi:hypothetical protein
LINWYVLRACQRRSSLHDRRDSISLRDLREEAQRFHESLLASKVEDEDEGEHAESTSSSLPSSSTVNIFFSVKWNTSL